MYKVHFYDETIEVKRYYTIDEEQESLEHSADCSYDANAGTALEISRDSKEASFYLEQALQENRPSPHNSILLPSSCDGVSPFQESELSLDSGVFPSPPGHLSLNRSWKDAPSPQSQPFSLSEREAILMRNFVENMALWADITDPQRHFEVEVPMRAVDEPVLRFAIFAFSSRHIDRQENSETAEALQYHNHCLQLLIPVLSGVRDDITEVILAAVAILRQHEEMDCEDNQFHLTGTTRILNTVSSFGSSGGLGEAAAWLCLRQDIYISLTSQKPLRTDLQSFDSSDVFQRNDDFAWASRMVFLLAKVLKCAFSHESSTAQRNVLRGIEGEVENWNITKPRTFNPIRFVPRSQERQMRFPSIWMLLSVHVVGLQYYHLAKIVLAFSSRPSSLPAYENFRHSRNIEKTVRNHLLTVLGLAKSNTKAENTLFTARHSLVAWGWVLRHKLDQEAAEDLLKDMETTTGWNMKQLIQSLRDQWQEENSDD
ncbi:hypothetical protein AWENTII_011709 [Aspergillus wentii]